MPGDELRERVCELRAGGLSPKEIARSLGASPAAVSACIRWIASQAEAERVASEPAVIGCWVNEAWNAGLGIDGDPGWPGMASHPFPTGGLVGVVVAREAERSYKASVAAFLLDVHCLGAKNAMEPFVVRKDELAGFVSRFFESFDAPPARVPVELCRQLVFGSVRYARNLGFEPHPDFFSAAAHLGEPPEIGGIRFGCNGKPSYVEGPDDDTMNVLRTLDRSVGRGNYELLISVGEPGQLLFS